MPAIYLIPCFLADDAVETIPSYVLRAIKDCSVIFAENERTARRFLKSLDKSIVIDQYEWFAIHKAEEEQVNNFKKKIKEDKNIAIISEAGCPGIADPGQVLIAVAQEMNCKIKPLVGPNSILLALMASGMNGQQFEFTGYLPIDAGARIKKIKELEAASAKQNSTKIFIETPYRNNQLLESILQHCQGNTKLCLGINITAKDERIITLTVSNWKQRKPDLNKLPVVFLLYAGN
ncbi:MAG: SAM-dependent methyltransferase [Bacteroidetes bacterium]|jgi:16S rRNA (cytidine1402-2'-O)-methyltransferase|nr:SAM-dependent methyltransferase [Bacteroidota bacterium]